ncbi:unnamed protein product [Closterium sp. NIES-54]
MQPQFVSVVESECKALLSVKMLDKSPHRSAVSLLLPLPSALTFDIMQPQFVSVVESGCKALFSVKILDKCPHRSPVSLSLPLPSALTFDIMQPQFVSVVESGYKALLSVKMLDKSPHRLPVSLSLPQRSALTFDIMQPQFVSLPQFVSVVESGFKALLSVKMLDKSPHRSPVSLSLPLPSALTFDIMQPQFAPRLWQQYLHALLTRIGFKQLPHDQGMYRLSKNDNYILLIVYVDDLLYIGSNDGITTWFEGELHQDLTLTVSSTVTQYLGLNIQEEKDAIYLSAEKYADTIAKRFTLTASSITTPYRYVKGNHKEGSPLLKSAGIRDYQ